MSKKKKTPVSVREIRNAIADYMASEGCSCCRSIDEHEANQERLGKLLRVPRYPDGTGRDFYRFRTKKP